MLSFGSFYGQIIACRINVAAELMGVDFDDLLALLVMTTVETSSKLNAIRLNCQTSMYFVEPLFNCVDLAGSQLHPRSQRDAINVRNSLAKSFYSRLFGWLVKNINQHMNGGSSEIMR